MPSTRLQRSAETLDELRDAVRSEFGPSARIVAAEKITSGGLGGLFRKAHYEATVEIPDPSESPTVRVAITADRTARVGILALLEEAEEQEDLLAGSRRGRRAAPPIEEAGGDELAERSDAFASIMDDFTFNGLAPAATLGDVLAGRDAPSGAPTGLPAESSSGSEPTPAEERAAFEALASPVPSVTALPPASSVPAATSAPSARPGGPSRVARDGALPKPPALRDADGDLVAVVGRAADAAAVAARFAEVGGLRLVEATDRRAGILARAAGVEAGCGSVTPVSWSLGVTSGPTEAQATLEGLGPDQVWVIVDAGRKHEDTARDVRSIAAAVPVAGLVVVGAGETSSPDTVHLLGLPVIDARSL